MSQHPAVAIITDSTSDLVPRVAAQRGIITVPLNVHFGDDVYRDQVDITTNEFMRRMANASKLPTTSQPSVGAFETAFREAAQTYDQAVCVLISSRLSGTIQSASIAAQNVNDLIQIEIVDTFNVSYGLGFQVLRAAELAAKGLSATEIATKLRSEVNAYHIVFFVETLEHLRRGGRIGKAAQLVGSLLQLRPLLRIDEGQVVPFERTRTRSKAIDALVAFGQSFGAIEELAIIYNTTPEEARNLAERVAPLTPHREVTVAQLGPVVATHIGPDVLGLIVREKSSD
jgi:DegV family protein with EDD domain